MLNILHVAGILSLTNLDKDLEILYSQIKFLLKIKGSIFFDLQKNLNQQKVLVKCFRYKKYKQMKEKTLEKIEKFEERRKIGIEKSLKKKK